MQGRSLTEMATKTTGKREGGKTFCKPHREHMVSVPLQVASCTLAVTPEQRAGTAEASRPGVASKM